MKFQRSISVDSIQIVEKETKQQKAKAYQDPNLDPQTKVILEFVETEEDYVNDLQTIVDVYINPLEKDTLVTKQDITDIFASK